MNGKTSGLYCAIAKFENENGQALKGEPWTVRVYDQDLLLDDCLGEARLDEQGRATFLLAVADIKSIDSPDERNPDLYFTLFNNGIEIFRREVLEDIDFESLHRVSGDPVQITREFGPYLVKTEKAR